MAIQNRLLVLIGTTTQGSDELMESFEHCSRLLSNQRIKDVTSSFAGHYPSVKVYVIDVPQNGTLVATATRNSTTGVVTTALVTGSQSI